MNPITFSTLACPRWDVETILAKATEYGFNGIEWRGGPQGHVQPDLSAIQSARLRQQCADMGLKSIAITAYTSFVSEAVEERQANVDELRRYCDLAAELNATYVRAFLGELPAGTKIDSHVYEKISDCLSTAVAYAESIGVSIAIEPHDDFVRSSTIIPILDQVQHPALRVIWDIGNMFAAGEAIGEGFKHLKNRLAYVQVKDGKGSGNNWQLCLLGNGDVPLNQAFELLRSMNYPGAFSVEWEYAWHPELDPPEVALPAALRTIQKFLVAPLKSESTQTVTSH